MPDARQEPRFSCSPAVLIGIFALVLGSLLWNGARALLGSRYAPDAAARPVVARGDLAADEQATVELFRTTSPSVVNIMNLDLRRSLSIYRADLDAVPQGLGTGFIWDERGYVVTNHHVVLGADTILVTLADGSEWQGTVIGAEPDFDLAVVKIDAPARELPPIAVGASNDLLVGQKVFAIGNPFGLDQTLTTGIISGLGRVIESISGREIQDVIQTDAAINPGNSGGPLLDSAGRLVGVNTAIKSPTGTSAGIGFAVPVDTVNRVVPELIRGGRFVRPGLGVVLWPEEVTERLGLEGALVRSVLPGSAAERAGLQEAVSEGSDMRGDRIVGVGGTPVRRNGDLQHRLAQYGVGETVTLELVRGGQRLDVQVTLQSIE